MDTKTSDEKNLDPAPCHSPVDRSKPYATLTPQTHSASFLHASPPGHPVPQQLAPAFSWTHLEAEFSRLVRGACSSDVRSLLMHLEVNADRRSSRCTRAGARERADQWAAVAHGIACVRQALDVLSIGEPSVSISFEPTTKAQREKLFESEGSSVYERPSGGQHAAVLP